MRIDIRSMIIGAAMMGVLLVIGYGIYVAAVSGTAGDQDQPKAVRREEAKAGSAKETNPKLVHSLAAQSVELSASEFAKYKVKPVGEHDFTIAREAIGTIDFNQEMSVQVFSPFPGKIIELFAKAGDDVKKGDALFTIDSPDLLQTESTLLAAAGTFNTTTRALERAKQLYEIQGISQKDLDSATSDQQAAEGALKAARNAVRIFGKTEADVDHILTERRIDSVLRVYSPISGKVTSRNAAPGVFVQPGNAPAPYSVADVSTKWLLANVAEVDIPLLRLGQRVDVTLQAYPERVFRGELVNIGAAVDLNTHRVLVRSEVRDPAQELRPGMFAKFVIRTGRAMRSLAVPNNGVVREGDGAMTVWITTDGRRLVKRVVQTGLQQEGFTQILDGLKSGEQVATENALFLSNALTAASR